jgi:hypothetical protein
MMIDRWKPAVPTLALAALLACTPIAAGQSTPPADPGADDPPPSLDELLGIEENEGRAGAEEAARRDRREELERRLNEEAITDAFKQALEKMTVSAALLDEQFDPGLATQRVQEEILGKLAQLIEKAQEQQQQQGGGGSSSSSSERSQQSAGAEPGRQDNRGERGEQEPCNGEGAEQDPPPRQEGPVNAVLEESRSEWGNLPQRVRDMLMQGRREKFSSLYEQMTREYYKRLAEEGSS